MALIARAVVWPVYAVGNPSFYELAWGGPTLAGAVAVHRVPGVVLLVAGPWLLRRLTRLSLLAAGVERVTVHPASVGRKAEKCNWGKRHRSLNRCRCSEHCLSLITQR